MIMRLEGRLLGDLFTREIPRELHTFAREVIDAHSKRAQVLAKEEAPKLTGALARTIAVTKTASEQDEFVRTVTPTRPYAEAVHEGTGLFGPFRRRIVPKFKRAMRWIGSNGQAVFARSTAGQQPNRFLDRAFKRLLAESDRLIDRLWGKR